jgi:K+-sensing histidine kinase KdpD
MLFMTAIALFVSSKSKNSFISVVTLAAILYIPAIDMSQTSLLADKILKLFPFNIISPSGSFEIGVLYDVFGKMLTQPVMMIIAAVLVSALLVPLSCRIFRNHQVIN